MCEADPFRLQQVLAPQFVGVRLRDAPALRQHALDVGQPRRDDGLVAAPGDLVRDVHVHPGNVAQACARFLEVVCVAPVIVVVEKPDPGAARVREPSIARDVRSVSRLARLAADEDESLVQLLPQRPQGCRVVAAGPVVDDDRLVVAA